MNSRSRTADSTAKAAALIGKQTGEHKVVVDPDLLEGFALDESEAEPVVPDAVVRVENAEDIRCVLKTAEELDVPVTPRAGGTGKSGGAVPVCGGIVMAFSRMNQLMDIDRENLLAVVEPGMILKDFQEEVEKAGLFFPPDPASLDSCALGGNVAENAGGPRAFKYGVTREYVLGLDCLLMGGTGFFTGRRTVKGVAGYDVASLLVGSEGTLAVFSRIMLRLIRNPVGIATLLAEFDTEISAARAVSAIISRGLVPRVLELIDSACVDTARREGKMAIPENTGCLLLIEVDGEEDVIEKEIETLADLLEKQKAVNILAAQDSAQRDRLWTTRRELSELIKRRAVFKIADDVAVPRAALPDALEAYRKAGDRYGVEVASFGHAGDGNLHVNVLWNDEALADNARKTVDGIMQATLDLGGTITGEHGVGHVKAKYLAMELSPESAALQKRLKNTFDPKGLLNPGKLFIT